MRHLRWIAALGALTLVLLFVLSPKIPQPQAYHDFADQRTLVAGIPNTLDVLSNLGFAAAALFGLAVMRREREFANALERTDAKAFFIGTLLTSIGSAWYHLHPNDATLVYDRAGMIVAFMAFLSMIIHERHDGAAWLLTSLLTLGAASVVYWRVFDDLRLYGWVQFFPMLAVLAIVILDKPRHTREIPALVVVLIAYALAKAFETCDKQTFDALQHTISGHTLKHLSAAVAPAAIAWWIVKRSVAPAASKG